MQTTRNGPIRVVVVEDSPTMRDLLVAILQGAAGIQVVAAGANGEEALRLVHRLHPDVVTMDVRMPKMDGLEATRRIMREAPTRIIIVTASLMRADTDLAFEALRAGALTVLEKPVMASAESAEKLVRSVRLMADVPVIHHWGRSEQRPAPRELQPPNEMRAHQVRAIGVAASTGGPAALAALLRPLPAGYPIPILVVQHITPNFAGGLADWLDTQTALEVHIARQGETPAPGTVVLAPDGVHLQIDERGAVDLCKEPAYKGLRPSANYLFHSLARAFGRNALGIVLTGMGDDGADGLETLHRAGAHVIAQDEESCVVYGMPREAVERGVVDRSLRIEQIIEVLLETAT